MTTTVWTSKYALSEGITPLDLPHDVDIDDDGYLSFFVQEPLRHHFYGRRDWHRTRDEAVKRAEEMRVKKIASLEKQIAKLKKLDFGGAA